MPREPTATRHPKRDPEAIRQAASPRRKAGPWHRPGNVFADAVPCGNPLRGGRRLRGETEFAFLSQTAPEDRCRICWKDA